MLLGRFQRIQNSFRFFLAQTGGNFFYFELFLKRYENSYELPLFSETKASNKNNCSNEMFFIFNCMNANQVLVKTVHNFFFKFGSSPEAHSAWRTFPYCYLISAFGFYLSILLQSTIRSNGDTLKRLANQCFCNNWIGTTYI